ncbi:VPS9 domain [Dillenia turbinata]|uniref:VPS9 domain n=1 Tax=Dillenia turbinata TaxID=194707 RepID=A0AAN8V970_9MAGN
MADLPYNVAFNCFGIILYYFINRIVTYRGLALFSGLQSGLIPIPCNPKRLAGNAQTRTCKTTDQTGKHQINELKQNMKLCKLCFFPPSFLGLAMGREQQLNLRPFNKEKELQKINAFKSPHEKLLCILNCCRVINNLLLNVSMSENRVIAGADDSLPDDKYILLFYPGMKEERIRLGGTKISLSIINPRKFNTSFNKIKIDEKYNRRKEPRHKQHCYKTKNIDFNKEDHVISLNHHNNTMSMRKEAFTSNSNSQGPWICPLGYTEYAEGQQLSQEL